MPVHDWSQMAPSIFHDFHHSWIYEISRLLNGGVLPPDYYALIEPHGQSFSSDVPTLRMSGQNSGSPYEPRRASDTEARVSLAPPIELTAEGEMAFCGRKQNCLVVRHVSDDHIVAIVEVVAPSSKRSQYGIDSFLRKACELFDRDIHLLILDLHPPGPRDPGGIHGAIWDYFQGQPYTLPLDRPITLAAYECDLSVRAYVQHVAIGNSLPSMPLFLQPGGHVLVPLEESYQAAFEAVPRVWRSVLE